MPVLAVKNTDIVHRPAELELLTWCTDWCPLLPKMSAPFIAGGFVRDFVIKSRPSDMDLYFRNEDCFEAAKRIIEESGDYNLACETDKALTYTNKEGRRPIQLIKYIYGQPPKILADFDFVMSMGGVDIVTKQIYCHPNFTQDLIERRLTYNPETTPFRLSTLKRVVKFVTRGFIISDEDLFAIAVRINKMSKKTIRGYEERNGEDAGPWQDYD